MNNCKWKNSCGRYQPDQVTTVTGGSPPINSSLPCLYRARCVSYEEKPCADYYKVPPPKTDAPVHIELALICTGDPKQLSNLRFGVVADVVGSHRGVICDRGIDPRNNRTLPCNHGWMLRSGGSPWSMTPARVPVRERYTAWGRSVKWPKMIKRAADINSVADLGVKVFRAIVWFASLFA